MTTRSDRCTNF